ncbi:hypothetical protein Q499_0649 [Chlamydia suis MD56]|nr:hypothetical protein Q499_0649 [Chlamydia suis MD56]
MANSFRNQKQGLQAVLRAARVISQMFSQTIGPYGYGTIVHHVSPPKITHDSQRMLKDFVLPDVFENLGVNLYAFLHSCLVLSFLRIFFHLLRYII